MDMGMEETVNAWRFLAGQVAPPGRKKGRKDGRGLEIFSYYTVNDPVRRGQQLSSVSRIDTLMQVLLVQFPTSSFEWYFVV